MNCVFIIYVYNNNAYEFLVHKSDFKDIYIYIYIYPKTIIESRNDIFFEDMFP
jgi:hypothetical protein